LIAFDLYSVFRCSLFRAVEAEANNKTPETTRELEQRKLIVNDAISKLNQLLGISAEIRLPEVEKSLSELKESMDYYLGGGLQGADRMQASGKLGGPQGSLLHSQNQPVCEFSVELKELAGTTVYLYFIYFILFYFVVVVLVYPSSTFSFELLCVFPSSSHS
jgi:hypothetical protein